mmetsp:Transcript_18980/g.47123  ORF Transcript_18980/g.47123 Transcript_18980/m.47123 type:complete len:236 (+) Transcript_18980:2526-3233(+)
MSYGTCKCFTMHHAITGNTHSKMFQPLCSHSLQIDLGNKSMSRPFWWLFRIRKVSDVAFRLSDDIDCIVIEPIVTDVQNIVILFVDGIQSCRMLSRIIVNLSIRRINFHNEPVHIFAPLIGVKRTALTSCTTDDNKYVTVSCHDHSAYQHVMTAISTEIRNPGLLKGIWSGWDGFVGHVTYSVLINHQEEFRTIFAFFSLKKIWIAVTSCGISIRFLRRHGCHEHEFFVKWMRYD